MRIPPYRICLTGGGMKGFAHVDFQNSAIAEKAVTELNGIELLGRQIRVDHARRAEDRV